MKTFLKILVWVIVYLVFCTIELTLFYFGYVERNRIIAVVATFVCVAIPCGLLSCKIMDIISPENKNDFYKEEN